MLKDIDLNPRYLLEEYTFLEAIETRGTNITQREIATLVGKSPAMVNTYIDDFEKNKLIRRYYHSKKTVVYTLTEKGRNRKKELSMNFLKSALSVYNATKGSIIPFFQDLVNKGIHNILFYGAGEVAEMLLYVLQNENIDVFVLAIIDDDQQKQGQKLRNVEIISLDNINNYQFDKILISTYTWRTDILNKLLEHHIDNNLIMEFF